MFSNQYNIFKDKAFLKKIAWSEKFSRSAPLNDHFFHLSSMQHVIYIMYIIIHMSFWNGYTLNTIALHEIKSVSDSAIHGIIHVIRIHSRRRVPLHDY